MQHDLVLVTSSSPTMEINACCFINATSFSVVRFIKIDVSLSLASLNECIFIKHSAYFLVIGSIKGVVKLSMFDMWPRCVDVSVIYKLKIVNTDLSSCKVLLLQNLEKWGQGYKSWSCDLVEVTLILPDKFVHYRAFRGRDKAISIGKVTKW